MIKDMKKNISYVFLILHYLSFDDTKECIDSIRQKCNSFIYKIIVVDNGSTNDSFEKLLEFYTVCDDVVLLHSDVNLGFAKGNNLGFKYAKEILNPDFIIMINNDTIITDELFCEKIMEKYKEYDFAVLGPDIITKDGIHQNPWIRESMSSSQLKIFRIKQYIRIILTYIGMDSVIFKWIHKNDSRKNKFEKDMVNVPLHGAALIFSKHYIDKFDGLDPRTFLYFEEEILRLYCKKYNLLMVYAHDIELYHKEDVASKMENPKPSRKARAEYRNRIASSKVFEEIKKELGGK